MQETTENRIEQFKTNFSEFIDPLISALSAIPEKHPARIAAQSAIDNNAKAVTLYSSELLKIAGNQDWSDGLKERETLALQARIDAELVKSADHLNSFNAELSKLEYGLDEEPPVDALLDQAQKAEIRTRLDRLDDATVQKMYMADLNAYRVTPLVIAIESDPLAARPFVTEQSRAITRQNRQRLIDPAAAQMTVKLRNVKNALERPQRWFDYAMGGRATPMLDRNGR